MLIIANLSIKFILLKFTPIMPAFCLLLLYSDYSNNFANKIDIPLWLLPLKPLVTEYSTTTPSA